MARHRRGKRERPAGEGGATSSLLAEIIRPRAEAPELKLMRAILATVAEDVARGGEAAAEALDYVRGEDGSYLFSFPSVCRHLGLSRARVRAALGAGGAGPERAVA